MKVTDIATTAQMQDSLYDVYDDIALDDALAKYIARWGVKPKEAYRWAWYWYFPVPKDDELPLFAGMEDSDA